MGPAVEERGGSWPDQVQEASHTEAADLQGVVEEVQEQEQVQGAEPDL